MTEVHWWCIIANLGFKFRSHFTAHCGRRAACCRRAGRRAACSTAAVLLAVLLAGGSSRAMLASARLSCSDSSRDVRSFHHGCMARLLPVFATCLQPPPALRPRPGLVHFPSNAGACIVYFKDASLAGWFLSQGAKVRPSYSTCWPLPSVVHAGGSHHTQTPPIRV